MYKKKQNKTILQISLIVVVVVMNIKKNNLINLT